MNRKSITSLVFGLAVGLTIGWLATGGPTDPPPLPPDALRRSNEGNVYVPKDHVTFERRGASGDVLRVSDGAGHNETCFALGTDNAVTAVLLVKEAATLWENETFVLQTSTRASKPSGVVKYASVSNAVANGDIVRFDYREGAVVKTQSITMADAPSADNLALAIALTMHAAIDADVSVLQEGPGVGVHHSVSLGGLKVPSCP